MARSYHPAYRPDIDGLRALAISIVLAFHAFPQTIKGGFIGVDIFFVISGFLISTIIFKNLDQGNFSFKDFYARRVKRIFPAFLLVLASSFVFSWLFLFPDEYERLTRHIYKSASFILNFDLAHKGGYFSAQSDKTPLLHIWSLSIEEQFYLLWPFMLFALHRFARKYTFAALIFVTLASFICNIVMVQTDITRAFYLPFSRFWELSVGALLAYKSLYRPQLSLPFRKDALSVLGLGLIIGTFVMIDKEARFPGWWALAPTIGAYLIIEAGSAAFINKRILSNRVAIFIGLISYPLYLWHWPIFAFAKTTLPEAMWQKATIAGLVASFILAWLTYALLEARIRSSPRLMSVTVKLLVCMAILASLAATARHGNLPPRLENDKTGEILAAIDDWKYPGTFNFKGSDNFRSYVAKGKSKDTTIVIGDSHAEHYWPWFEKKAGAMKSPPTLNFTTQGGCIALPRTNRETGGYACDKFFAYALEQARKDEVKNVVFSSFWNGNFGAAAIKSGESPFFSTLNGKRNPVKAGSKELFAVLDVFENEIADLNKRGKKVFIILSNPTSADYDPKTMISRFSGSIRSTSVDRKIFEADAKPIHDRLIAIAKRQNVIILDPADTLCTDTECPTLDGQRPLYKDTNHIRPFAAVKYGDFLDATLE